MVAQFVVTAWCCGSVVLSSLVVHASLNNVALYSSFLSLYFYYGDLYVSSLRLCIHLICLSIRSLFGLYSLYYIFGLVCVGLRWSALVCVGLCWSVLVCVCGLCLWSVSVVCSLYLFSIQALLIFIRLVLNLYLIVLFNCARHHPRSYSSRYSSD